MKEIRFWLALAGLSMFMLLVVGDDREWFRAFWYAIGGKSWGL
ncbi:hypothetical protein [Cupriavidus sp. CP313]